MAKPVLTFFVLLLSITVYCQNLFPKKLDNCSTSRFCLDCGDEKANVDKDKFDLLLGNLNSTNNVKGVKGKIMFQILVDSTGKGCVLSHSDVSDNIISRNIVAALNSFNGFTPAKTGNKPEERASFNMVFDINNGTIKANVERVDMNAFKKSFDKPNSPEIYNKNYVYKNEHLKDYKVTVWNAGNSNLPDNMNDHITIDKDGLIWLTIDEGLVTFNGSGFKRTEQDVFKEKFIFYGAVATDNNNVKWFSCANHIYSYANKKWTRYGREVTGIRSAYKIINNPASGEVFFCSDTGLIIYKNGNWRSITREKVPAMPSNSVYFAKRDSKNRIWLGTFSGSVMIDENGNATSFNDTKTMLKGQCIDGMDEDENGNIYFSLFEYNSQPPGQVNKNEGIGVVYADGTMKQFTTTNSGMPFNHTTSVLYDKKEKVLWISTDRAGLVRYDLNDGWENYHSENSDIPTSYISTMAFDNNGVLYLATRQGLVRVERK